LLSLQSGASDVYTQHLAGVGHQKLPRPLGEIGPTLRYQVLGFEGALQGTEFGS
jgi:hypothetical protein